MTAQARFTRGQADRTREWCRTIARVPGMVIAPFNWHTATAFWDGYMLAMDGDPFSEFREWGLKELGATESNLSPLGVLRSRFTLPDDDLAAAAELAAEA